MSHRSACGCRRSRAAVLVIAAIATQSLALQAWAGAPYSQKHDIVVAGTKQTGSPPVVPSDALPNKRSGVIARRNDKVRDLDALLKAINATADRQQRGALALAYLESARLLPPKEEQAAILWLETKLKPLPQ
jgi:hypothetical protein